jgi:vacuolar-type H+-ATPase subunit I/STV1
MIALGVILLILGYVLKVYVLSKIGIILVVIGAVLWVVGAVGRPVAGRRYWY